MSRPARTLGTGVVLIVAFVLGLFAARHWFAGSASAPVLTHATFYPSPRTLGELELTDQDGRPFTADALRGHWWLVFFGFTQCPDVCPTTLATLARARAQLTDLPAALQPRVLLISVDPERDTPERLAAYVRHFDREFSGATGTLQAIAETTKRFGVPYAKVAAPGGGYTLDHGAGVFFVDPQATIRAYSSAPHDASVLATDYRALVSFRK